MLIIYEHAVTDMPFLLFKAPLQLFFYGKIIPIDLLIMILLGLFNYDHAFFSPNIKKCCRLRHIFCTAAEIH